MSKEVGVLIQELITLLKKIQEAEEDTPLKWINHEHHLLITMLINRINNISKNLENLSNRTQRSMEIRISLCFMNKKIKISKIDN